LLYLIHFNICTLLIQIRGLFIWFVYSDVWLIYFNICTLLIQMRGLFIWFAYSDTRLIHLICLFRCAAYSFDLLIQIRGLFILIYVLCLFRYAAYLFDLLIQIRGLFSYSTFSFILCFHFLRCFLIYILIIYHIYYTFLSKKEEKKCYIYNKWK